MRFKFLTEMGEWEMVSILERNDRCALAFQEWWKQMFTKKKIAGGVYTTLVRFSWWDNVDIWNGAVCILQIGKAPFSLEILDSKFRYVK